MTMVEARTDLPVLDPVEVTAASLEHIGYKPETIRGPNGEEWTVYKDPRDTHTPAPISDAVAIEAVVEQHPSSTAGSDLDHFVMNEPGYVKV